MNIDIDEEMIDKFQTVLNSLPDEERRILFLDMENEYEGRDMLYQKLGVTGLQNVQQRIRYLKERVRKMMTGEYYGLQCYKDGKPYKKYKDSGEASRDLDINIKQIQYSTRSGKIINGYTFKKI